MKVCHLVLTDSPYGAFNVALSLAEAESKYIETLVAMNADALPFVGRRDLATILLPISLTKGWPTGTRWLSLRRQGVDAAGELHKAVKRLGVEILHVHLPNAFPVAVAYRGTTPKLMTIHGVFYESALTRALGSVSNRMLFKKGFQVTVVNRDLLRYASKTARVPVGSVTFVPNGIDAGRIRTAAQVEDGELSRLGLTKKPRSGPVICFVGRLERRKGPELLLGAMPELGRLFPGIRCVFVGDGPIKRELEAKTARLGEERSVVFAGFQENPYRFMRASDVVVTNLSAELGGVSLVHFEAAALGLPLVTLFDANKFEVFGDSVYYTKEERAVELARVLGLALEDVRAGRAKIASFDEKASSWDAISLRYIDLYRKLLGST